MPKAQGYRYIAAARDDLSGAAEGRALRKNTSEQMAKFIWEEIFCRYGAVGQVTTDNGSEVKGAFTILMELYKIPQVMISPYNSKANGVVERGHFTIREAIIKACEGKINLWPKYVHHAFFADRITVRRATGFSPYYLLHGVHPALPFDLLEASFLVEGFTQEMSDEDLLALRIRQLEKKPQDVRQAADTLRLHRLQSKEQFEKRFKTRLVRNSYPPGTLVIVRNTEVEKSLDYKHQDRYLGPYKVVRRTLGGSYVLSELNNAIWRQKVAAFRILPYISRTDAQLEMLAEHSSDSEEENAQLSQASSEESESENESSSD